MFPGLPNGTEVGQECDQLFAEAKRLNYMNRDILLHHCRRLGGENNVITLSDIGYMVFGGEVPLSDGTTLQLKNAFDKAFAPHHILSACAKCGYLPSTREALNHPKVRHEAVMDKDGNVDTEADPLGELYSFMERENHATVEELIALNFPAGAMKLFIRKVTAAQTTARAERITLPNTRSSHGVLNC